MQPMNDAAVDLVVVGAGAGGMTAALVAALEGLRVVLCESTQQVGGTTATSAGTLWAPGNRHGAEAGHADSIAHAERYLEALIGPDDPRGLRAAFLRSVAPAVDDLERRSAVAFASSGRHPDYLDLPGAARSGRAISPRPFDGRLLGHEDFRRVRPPLPSFMVLGGMMVGKTDVQALVHRYASWPNFAQSARLVARHVLDRLRYPRGTRLVMGNALVARLLYSLRQARVDIRFGWRLSSLAHEEGRVVGAWFDVDGGPRQLLRARRGVVLATGGIGHNPDLRRALGPEAMGDACLAAEGVAGDGLTAARRVGAAIEEHPGNFFWQPVSKVPARGRRPASLFPHLYLDRAKPGLVAVDASGQRFVNEALSYHHFVDGMLRAHAQRPALPAWLVCDAGFVARYGLGVVPPRSGPRTLRAWARRGYLVVAPTLPELARRLGVHPQALSVTVAEANDAARTGKDPRFGKGETAFDRFNGDASVPGNPCLGPIASAPFVALAVWPADAASSAGLATDEDGRALDARGAPIAGLYACGNDAASVMRGSYPGPGTTLGPAIAGGWRVALHAARGSHGAA